MGKFIADAVLDLPADDLIANGNKLTLCAGQPASYAEATSAPAGGKMLAEVTLDGADYTKADGDTSGRKVTVGAQAGTIATSGTADHVAIVDTVAETLKAVTTITSQAVTASNAFNLGAFDIEFGDPS